MEDQGEPTEVITENRTRWTSRKFVSAWILQIVNTTLLVTRFLPADSYVQVTGFLWACYFGANTSDKWTSQRRTSLSRKF